MDYFSGSGSLKFISFRLGEEMSGQTLQDNAEEMETNPPPAVESPETEVTELPIDKRSIVELSSTSDSESCGQDGITRKMESLGVGDPFTIDSTNESCEQNKTSVSDPVIVMPGLNVLIPEDSTYLERSEPPTEILVTSHTESQERDTSCVVQPKSSSNGPAAQSAQLEGDSSEGLELYAPSVDKGLMGYRSNTDDYSRFGMEIET